MKEKAAIAIAALMLASLAAGLSVSTTVSAAHTPSVSVDKTVVKGGENRVFTFTVTNASGSDAIKSVQITLPSGSDWKGGYPLKKLLKDNQVEVADNKVVLPAGTILEVELDNTTENSYFVIPENTDVIIPVENRFYYQGYIYTLRDNAIMEPRQPTNTENMQNLINSTYMADNKENLKVPVALPVVLTDNRLRLVQDTLVIWESGNTVILPENTLLKVVSNPENTLENENFALTAEIEVKVTNNRFRCVSSSLNTAPSLSGTNMAGAEVELVDNIVVIPAGTVVGIVGRVKATVFENTVVIRENGNPLQAPTFENVPANWMQDHSVNQWTIWTAIGDNTLKGGENLSFPVSLAAPTAAGTYTFYVSTTDVNNITKDTPVQITVDNAPPSLTISVSPSWVKGSTQVTITVKGNEPFTFDNVLVAENKATENVSVTMTPNADSTEWTGTYTTSENENRDGLVTIYVVNAKDAVGNSISVSDNTKLFVDRRKPVKPDLAAMGFPVAWDPRSSFAINWILNADNDNLVWTPSTFSPEGMKLVILVDNTPIELTAGPTGRVSYTLTLSDGKHTVGAYIVDKAGNKGAENLENVVIDNNKPTIRFVYPENGAYIKDNKPTLRVTIADTVGVENSRHITGTDDNYGYRVALCYENGDPLPGGDNLVPKADPTAIDNIWGNIVFTTFTFENAWPTALADNTYILRVLAGDNFRFENLWIKFTVDTRAPSPPPAASLVGSITAGTLASPTGTKTKTFTLRGTAEASATVKVYVTTDGGVTWTEVTTARTTAGTDGSWMTQLDLSQYAGETLGIAVTATDAAGNESDRTLYGYVIYDASAPKVSITSPKTGTKTSKASIEVTGTVTKDSWEDWSDITLRIQVGTGAVTVPVSGTGDTATFSYSVALSEGTNTILVYVSDGMNSSSASVTVTRTVTPWGTYAVVLVIIALIIAAIAILRVRK
ncbi:MAG: hypothetical protein DSO04_06345 [Hadesarchaea archaeon]|nr:MAG: hypothetical protein DSO04_06345 [Hadesarchaea archaeon]